LLDGRMMTEHHANTGARTPKLSIKSPEYKPLSRQCPPHQHTHTYTTTATHTHRPFSQTWKSQPYSRQNSGEAGPPVQRNTIRRNTSGTSQQNLRTTLPLLW